jgi:hypothetical protein
VYGSVDKMERMDAMKDKLVVVEDSKYGFAAKCFVACDDGSRICIGCLGEIDGCLNEYGPVRKYGECYHCGFKVEQVKAFVMV